MLAAAFIKGFDLLAPGFTLAVIDLAKIQHLSLHHLPRAQRSFSTTFPVTKLFAVFKASVGSQEHPKSIYSNGRQRKRFTIRSH